MKHSITNRIIIGKTIGFVAGLLVFFLVPMLGVDLELKFGLGLILFYTILGSLIGLMGVMTQHPIFNFSLPWWLRGLVVGISMHAMLVLLTYDQIAAMAGALNTFGMTSPWWALLDGTILGLIIAWAATRFAGEGKLPLK